MKMNGYYPSLPIVSTSLRKSRTLSTGSFSRSVREDFPSLADREKAARFDLKEAIRLAVQGSLRVNNDL